MLNFGKLNFSVSFNPTSAFPLDAREFFDSFSSAQQAAQQAVEVGSSDGVYYIGQLLTVVEGSVAKVYQIQPNKTLSEVGSGGGTGGGYNIGNGLLLDSETNTLSVDVANDAEEDNTRPISSAAVYTELGNIDALLQTI